jgi:hypothetical protein
MKRVVFTIIKHQFMLIPSCAILNMQIHNVSGEYKYRIAFGWLQFYVSIGVAGKIA